VCSVVSDKGSVLCEVVAGGIFRKKLPAVAMVMREGVSAWPHQDGNTKIGMRIVSAMARSSPSS